MKLELWSAPKNGKKMLTTYKMTQSNQTHPSLAELKHINFNLGYRMETDFGFQGRGSFHSSMHCQSTPNPDFQAQEFWIHSDYAAANGQLSSKNLSHLMQVYVRSSAFSHSAFSLSTFALFYVQSSGFSLSTQSHSTFRRTIASQGCSKDVPHDVFIKYQSTKYKTRVESHFLYFLGNA